MRAARVDDQALDQFPHQRGEPVVLLPANVVVFLAGACLAPKGIPDGDFARTGDVRIEVEIHQALERGDRIRLEPGDRLEHPPLEFRGEELQRGDHHGGFGIEIESNDTG